MFLGEGEKSRIAMKILKMTSMTIQTVTIVMVTVNLRKKTWIRTESIATVTRLMKMAIFVVVVATNIEKEEKMKEERNETRNRVKFMRVLESIAAMGEERRKIMVTAIDRMIGAMDMATGENLTPLIISSKDMEVEEVTTCILLIAGATAARTPMVSRATMTSMRVKAKSLTDINRSHPALMNEESAGIRMTAVILPSRARANTHHETVSVRGPGVARITKIIITIAMTAAVAIIAETIFQGITITTGARIMSTNASPTDTIIPCHPETRTTTIQGDWKEGEN